MPLSVRSSQQQLIGLAAIQQEEERIRKVYAARKSPRSSDRYSYSNPANRFSAEERDNRLFAGLQRHGCMPLTEKRVLDVGCGAGYRLQAFLRWGSKPENLCGIDLLPDEIAKARHVLPPQVTLQTGNALQLNYADGSFDLVLQYLMFSSILHAGVKAKIAQEMLRVVKKGGFIVWYDFFVDNPWNRDVRGVRKSEIYQLFPGCRCWFERMTVAAPLARAMGKTFPQAFKIVSRLRIFSTHYLAFLQRPASSEVAMMPGRSSGDAP